MAIILSCRPGIKFEDSQSQTFIKYFGGGIEQHGKDLIETDDNGFALVGSTNSYGNGKLDVYLVKTDKFGNQEWFSTFGGIGDDEANCIDVTQDKGYILGGYISIINTSSGNNLIVPQSFLAIKTDSKGSMQWLKKIGDTISGKYQYQAKSVKSLSDGYVLAGQTSKIYLQKYGNISQSELDVFKTQDISDYYLVKIKTNGDTLWSAIYGLFGKDKINSVLQSPSNADEFYFCGSTYDPIKRKNNMVNVRSRVDASILSPTFAFNNDNNSTYSADMSNANQIIQIPQGFMMVGTVTNGNGNMVYTLKFNPMGQILDYKTYELQGNAEGISIASLKKGGYVILSSVRISQENQDILLMKVKEDGVLEWNKTFGGSFEDIASKVIECKDGNIAFTGTISFGVLTNKMMILAKVSKDGNLDLKN